MGNIILILENNSIQVMFGLIIFSLFLLLINMISQYRISILRNKYIKLTNGNKGDSLEEILFNHLDEVKKVEKEIEEIKEFYNRLDTRLKKTIQKVGIIRYNAFDDMGSDLSFSLALLDESNNGVVISNLYGRNESTTYAKPIKNAESRYKLSIEEMQAIDRAKNYELSSKDKSRKFAK